MAENTNFKVLDLPFLYKVLFFFCASKQPQTNPKISSILVLKHWFLLLVQNTYIFTNMHTMKEWVSNFKSFHIQSDSLVGVLKEGTALCIICPEEKKNNLERLFPPPPSEHEIRCTWKRQYWPASALPELYVYSRQRLKLQCSYLAFFD